MDDGKGADDILSNLEKRINDVQKWRNVRVGRAEGRERNIHPYNITARKPKETRSRNCELFSALFARKPISSSFPSTQRCAVSFLVNKNFVVRLRKRRFCVRREREWKEKRIGGGVRLHKPFHFHRCTVLLSACRRERAYLGGK